jgi:glycosyltransferase involved in cell wall biosynthesis
MPDMKYETAVAGFWPVGCVPMHLKALMLSGRPFVFFGPAKLYQLAAAEAGDVSHVKTCFMQAEPDGQDFTLRWLDEALSRHPEIKTVFVMELERFARAFFSPKLEKLYPNLFARQVRGNLFPRMCLYERRSLRDYFAYAQWQIWAVLARRHLAPQGLLVIGPTAKTIFPFCRLFPKAQRMLKECPEPYDRVLIPDQSPATPDQAPPSVLLFGYHTERKGTYWALETLAKFPKPLRVLVAGQCEDAARVQRLCAALPPHITAEMRLERISDQTKETLFKRARVILMPYDVFLGRSGLVFEAMIYRRQILASDACAFDAQLLASAAVSLHGRRQAGEFLQRLENSLDARPDWQSVDSFLDKHGIQKFADAVLPKPNQSLEKSTAPSHRSGVA